jgi:hypothetical protein
MVSRVLLVPVVALALCGAAEAGSALRVPPFADFGAVEAATYDESGVRVGPASLVVEKLDDGRVRVQGTSGFEGAPRTAVTALLEPAGDGSGLRPLRQESRSVDAGGQPLGVLVIDHEQRTGTCTPPGGGDPLQVVLPESDRVANVLLTQLLQPLAAARTGTFDFEILVCRPEARLLPAQARVAASADGLVEVVTAVQLGPLLTQMLGPFLPRISMWFDPDEAGRWIGQRMPLFAKGPTVFVLRAGTTPARLAAPRTSP